MTNTFNPRDILTMQDALRERGGAVGQSWIDSQDSARDNKPLALKAWLSNHDVLETLQVTVRDGVVTNAWTPGLREVDTTHASYAMFDGSRRDYSGLKHLAHSEDVYVCWNASMQAFITYRAI